MFQQIRQRFREAVRMSALDVHNRFHEGSFSECKFKPCRKVK